MRKTFGFQLFQLVVLVSHLTVCRGATAQELSPDLRQKIDGVAKAVLSKTGVPSASLAIAP